MQKFSYLKSQNAEYIDELFEKYLQNPDSVEPSWRYFFEGLELGTDIGVETVPNGHANGHANGNGNGNGHAKSSPITMSLGTTNVSFKIQEDAPSCAECGSIMVRNGSCYKCLNCGSTSGCS